MAGRHEDGEPERGHRAGSAEWDKSPMVRKANVIAGVMGAVFASIQVAQGFGLAPSDPPVVVAGPTVTVTRTVTASPHRDWPVAILLFSPGSARLNPAYIAGAGYIAGPGTKPLGE